MSEEQKACCARFDAGIEEINRFIIFCSFRPAIGPYKGEIFKYCPWCGEVIKHTDSYGEPIRLDQYPYNPKQHKP